MFNIWFADLESKQKSGRSSAGGAEGAAWACKLLQTVDFEIDQGFLGMLLACGATGQKC